MMRNENQNKRTRRVIGGAAVAAGLVGIYAATRSKEDPQTTVVMTVNAPIDKAFNYIAPINLMHIFRGTALISAIVDTSIKEGWDTPGLVRTIYFKDGSTSQETLLTVDAPNTFTYKNENFTSPALRFLLKRMNGAWNFIDVGSGQTKIEWTYTAVPTNVITRLVVETVLIRAIHSMLTNALTIAKEDLESGRLAGGQFAAARQAVADTA